jgi:hypothetical protein
MSTPPEHAPTERQPVVVSPAATSTPPVTPTPAVSRSPRGGGYDPVARIAQVIIAVVMVILLFLVLTGYHFHVTSDKTKSGGIGKHHTKVSHSP